MNFAANRKLSLFEVKKLNPFWVRVKCMEAGEAGATVWQPNLAQQAPSF